MSEFDPVGIFATLNSHGVRYVVIGGIAARLRGAPLVTEDVDVTAALDRDNLVVLCAALTEMGAKLRTASDPDGVPFPLEPEMLTTARSWTLTTRLGDLDIIFEPAGSRGYQDLIRDADTLMVQVDPEVLAPVASLRDIIRTKEAAARDKDRAVLPLLRRTQEELDRG
ncbi:MAG: hypothetical protein EXR91_00255 [Gemmatimonadetes bacterium]|nr:hypothetical protein [Gemmatimonadota bacterium]